MKNNCLNYFELPAISKSSVEVGLVFSNREEVFSNSSKNGLEIRNRGSHSL